MQKIQYIKDYGEKNAGDIEAVSNNVAHSLIENCVAILYRNRLFRSPVDKMMRTETRGERRAHKREMQKANKYKVK